MSASVTRPTSLVSAFGAAIHGFHRGPRAFFPEPVDVWLTALMDTVPFYDQCLVVCPSSMSNERAKALLRRAREHLPSAHLAPLRRRGQQTGINSMPKANSSRGILTGTMPSFISPLESVPAHSLDLVIFAANVFGEEMFHDTPWHMSLAHRALKPHGVVAITGYDPHVRIDAPSTAQKDTEDFLKDLDSSSRAVLDDSAEMDSLRGAMRRALDVSDSLRVGHADTCFPFPATQRRWFVSEFAATPVQLAAMYRALLEYQLLSTGKRGTWRQEGDEESNLGVARRRSVVDPLEALQGCIEVNESVRKRGGVVPFLRVHVHHFVVTCSNRTVNAIPMDQEMMRQPQFTTSKGVVPRLT